MLTIIAEARIKRVDREKQIPVSIETWKRLEEFVDRGRQFAADLIEYPPTERIGLVTKWPERTQENHREFIETASGWIKNETGLESPISILVLLVACLFGIQDVFWTNRLQRNKELYKISTFYSAMSQQLLTRLILNLSKSDTEKLKLSLEEILVNPIDGRIHFNGATTSAGVLAILFSQAVVVFEVPLHYDILYAGDYLVVWQNRRILYLQIESIKEKTACRFKIVEATDPELERDEKLRRVLNGASIFGRDLGVTAMPVIIRSSKAPEVQKELTKLFSELIRQFEKDH
ncbi:TPA: hypothetical protein DEA21_01170 [Candidatus Uhrbacteria bacterium]|nr:hypothetical protein [Candidatus Uhrbacteria bacterium]HCU32009.1 hypothetical protein [Candidatus Uhrbacteria bacterium]